MTCYSGSCHPANHHVVCLTHIKDASRDHRAQRIRRVWRVWRVWARDQGCNSDDGDGPTEAPWEEMHWTLQNACTASYQSWEVKNLINRWNLRANGDSFVCSCCMRSRVERQKVSLWQEGKRCTVQYLLKGITIVVFLLKFIRVNELVCVI